MYDRAKYVKTHIRCLFVTPHQDSRRIPTAFTGSLCSHDGMPKLSVLRVALLNMQSYRYFVLSIRVL